jgi:hypothetical protein
MLENGVVLSVKENLWMVFIMGKGNKPIRMVRGMKEWSVYVMENSTVLMDLSLEYGKRDGKRKCFYPDDAVYRGKWKDEKRVFTLIQMVHGMKENEKTLSNMVAALAEEKKSLVVRLLQLEDCLSRIIQADSKEIMKMEANECIDEGED